MPWGRGGGGNTTVHLKNCDILLFINELNYFSSLHLEESRAVFPPKYPQQKWGPGEVSKNKTVSNSSNTEPDQLLCPKFSPTNICCAAGR